MDMHRSFFQKGRSGSLQVQALPSKGQVRRTSDRTVPSIALSTKHAPSSVLCRSGKRSVGGKETSVNLLLGAERTVGDLSIFHGVKVHHHSRKGHVLLVKRSNALSLLIIVLFRAIAIGPEWGACGHLLISHGV